MNAQNPPGDTPSQASRLNLSDPAARDTPKRRKAGGGGAARAKTGRTAVKKSGARRGKKAAGAAAARKNQSARVTVVREPAPSATVRQRHWGITLSFVLLVLLPTALGAVYLYTRAVDQYSSTVGFSVRQEDFSSPVELLGGITDFASSGTSDSDILYEFIRSQEMVELLQERINLREIYSWPEGDPIFTFDMDGSIEDLHDYWSWMVDVIYDPSTGLIEVQTLAFRPEDAQTIARAILDESSRLVDELSAIAQDDTTAFARAELDRAVERLKEARETLTAFRSKTQIVDPTADLQSQMGVLSNLEQQLAAALIEADLLRDTTREDDPRIAQAERRIAVIEARIADERRKFGVGGGSTVAPNGTDYASLVAEFERLTVDREFAEQAYTASLAAYDTALAEARRKSRYLAAYINPTLAETAQYPQRWLILGIFAFFLSTAWAIGVLVYYSFRDRR